MEDFPPKIGKYRVIQLIGEGGMGAVYKAIHPTLNRNVIIKRLTLSGQSSFSERFKREATILLDLRNEHIVQVYDHFQEGTGFYIVMEYVDGISLDQLIKDRKTIPNEAAILIFAEICSALKHAHDSQVIHRDIKPANIMISTEGQVKLLDFGVATSYKESGQEGLTREGTPLGTPSYMAPEQINDAKNVDNRADIYSLGVLFYEMVTGKRPYQGGYTNEVFALILKGKYVSPRKINSAVWRWIQRIIKKSMHHKVHRRFQDIGQITAKLQRYLKRYPNQESIHSAIKLYLEGKDFSHLQKKRSFGPIFFAKLVGVTIVGLALLGFLFVGSYMGYKKGWYYEYFAFNQYGALQIQLKVTKGGKELEDKYIKVALFEEIAGKQRKINTISWGFSEDTQAKNSDFYLLTSRKVYLKENKYRILIEVENARYQTDFFLSPRILQKQVMETRNGRIIAFSNDPPSPPLPVRFSYSVRNVVNGELITDGIELYLLLHKKWIKWSDFMASEEFSTRFVSGKTFRFRLKKEGFYRKDYRINLLPDQDMLRLDGVMTPIPGTLTVTANSDQFELLLNNSNYYVVGGKKRHYKLINPLTSRPMKMRLSPGNYFLTIRSGQLFSETISRTEQISITSNQNRKIQIKYNPKSQSLRFISK